MSDLSMSILGFPEANRDLTVELRDPISTNVVATARPFLDGTVRIPSIDPGGYEVRLVHPNLTLPVLTRPIRVLPVGDTNISLLIDPSRFRNTPIADIPETNLTPVADTLTSVGETVLTLAHKRAGESIRADDWNSMASGIRDLAGAASELTRLVTPTGHDHPELVSKVEEMQTNFTTLLDTLSAAMTELQRQIQALRFQRQIGDLADRGALPEDRRVALMGIVAQLDQSITESPTVFARAARNVGVQLSTSLEQILDEHADDGEFLTSDAVRNVSQAVDLLREQRTTTYAGELEQHRRTDRTFGGGGLFQVQGGL